MTYYQDYGLLEEESLIVLNYERDVRHVPYSLGSAALLEHSHSTHISPGRVSAGGLSAFVGIAA